MIFNSIMFSLLQLGIVCSYAADDDIDISPEQYWESALPNTPMPKVITHLLGLGWYIVILKWFNLFLDIVNCYFSKLSCFQ